MVLTDRDKKLLYVLAVVVIVAVFGALLILPQWNKHFQLAEQLETAKNQQTEMETSIASLDSITKANAAAKNDYQAASKDFYELMESHAAERMITQIVLSHNLTTNTFDISATPQQAQMTAYIASQLGLTQGVTADQAAAATSGSQDGTASAGSTGSSSAGTADASNADAATTDADGEATGDEVAEEPINTMYVDYITLTASGSTENMHALVDDLVNNYPSLLVTSYSMNSQSGLTATNQVLEVSQVSIGLNLYMVDKSFLTTQKQAE